MKIAKPIIYFSYMIAIIKEKDFVYFLFIMDRTRGGNENHETQLPRNHENDQISTPKACQKLSIGKTTLS